MKNILPLLLSCYLLSACATLLNTPYTEITILTSEPSKIIVGSDTTFTKKKRNKATLSILRANEAVEVIAQTDSLSKTFVLSPKNSDTYWMNLFSNYGIGMLIDRDNPKRYDYKRRIFVNFLDTASIYLPQRIVRNKGELDLHLSLPYINHFYLQSPDKLDLERKFGFLGFSLGLDYYHSQNQYIQLAGGATTNFVVFVPVAVHYDGVYSSMSSLHLNLSNMHKIKRWTVGYGLSYAKNISSLNNTLPIPPEPKTDISHNLGFVFSTYYQTGNYFQIGLMYRPTFIRLKPNVPSAYEHLISIDFGWKIAVKK
ncbi:MAG: hypothetical protein ACPGVB_11875 [Chitinophagales bacterium]